MGAEQRLLWHARGAGLHGSKAHPAQRLAAVVCLKSAVSFSMRSLGSTGTDNDELLESQFYVGCKHRRIRGDAYYELLDEFISAAKRRWDLVTPD